MSESLVPVRNDLQGLTPYGAPQLDVPVRLNTNEMPWAPPQVFLDDLTARIQTTSLNRYPDRDSVELRTKLGELVGLPMSQTWVANGSNEILTQLMQAYGGVGRKILLFKPGYSAHPLLANVTQTDVVFAPLAQDLSLTPEIAAAACIEHNPDLVIIASPVNPTGVSVSTDAIRALHDNTSGLVVLDEAYVELSNDPRRSITLLAQCPRLVVTRTYSKAWRMAGLRLGYLYAPEWVVDDIQKVRLPYHLNTLTQLAGLAALAHKEAVTEHVGQIKILRDELYQQLQTLEGVTVWPSDANYLLFKLDNANHVFNELVTRGVLVRDFSSNPDTLDCLRVSIGTREENTAFIHGLVAILGI